MTTGVGLDEQFVIYGVIDSRDGRCRYVGLTSRTLRKRVHGHRSSCKDPKTPISHYFRKHGCDFSAFRILERANEGDLEHLMMLEKFWIAQMRDLGQADLNITDGGDCVDGYNVSDEHRRKTSLSQKSLWADEGYRDRMSKARREALACRSEDARDEYRRTRPRGARHGLAKLTEVDVGAIIQRLEQGEGVTVIAADYSVAYMTIYNIKKNVTWRHVPRNVKEK